MKEKQMDYNKKCDKYEALFVFNGEDALNKHIKECPDCQSEHDKYMKISALLKEAAPLYFKKKKEQKVSAVKKIACCMILIFGFTGIFYGYNMYNNNLYQNVWSDESYISSIGLPTDDYGFLDF